MEQNFINLYISKILDEAIELQKTKLLLQTQLAWSEKTIQEMTEFQNKLQEANNDLQAKLKAASAKKSKKLFSNGATGSAGSSGSAGGENCGDLDGESF